MQTPGCKANGAYTDVNVGDNAYDEKHEKIADEGDGTKNQYVLNVGAAVYSAVEVDL